MKKIICTMLALLMLFLCATSAMAAVSIRGISPGDKLYVDTPNHGTLNVRKSPSSTAKVLYKIDFGTKVVAGEEYSDGYLFVTVKGHKNGGYVDINYLSISKPKGTPRPHPTTTPAPQPEAETVVSLNFRSYKLVEDIMIVAAKPSRVGGWVNLRWVPSLQAAVIAKEYAGEEMRVIAEGKTWYQVQNEEGWVGFIYKKFTTPVYEGDGTDMPENVFAQ